MNHTEAFEVLLRSAGIHISEKRDIEARSARLKPLPTSMNPRVLDFIKGLYPDGVFSHQADAIEAALTGSDLVLATATASGKSLIFMSVAAHLAMSDADARVLALYPAKALIQDQLAKWRDLLDPLGLRFTFIDGDVPPAKRIERLSRAHVALMTPDVTHAWLMSHLQDRTVANFLQRLRLLILDEAHVYDGAFGTNMAFLLRRLEVAARRYQLICSTATLGQPADFVKVLTGRHPRAFGPAEDGAPSQAKTILLATANEKSFDTTVHALKAASEAKWKPFLAFADSRRAVEQLVAAVIRIQEPEDDGSVEEPADANGDSSALTIDEDFLGQVLPYRAGYESEDRVRIQESLASGQLYGVVSTSALELGLDIGEIRLVLLLNVPPSVKSFWQRVGRAGRRAHSACLMLDTRGALDSSRGGLDRYLARPVEPNWLYLENRYIQYAHALCAAVEFAQLGINSAEVEAFRSLPEDFRTFLDNELQPKTAVPTDLYPLKQRGEADPHHQFAIRGGIEQEFRVLTSQDQPLGRITASQAMREAYPGAVYYYMARPQRVWRHDNFRSIIRVHREKRYTTRPLSQTMVFPRLEGGVLFQAQSARGFVCEAEMQVSERVVGFIEQRGPNREEHLYEPGSKYSQRAVTRFFETTGVCWAFSNLARPSDEILQKLLEAYSLLFGVQERDLGIGLFHARSSSLGPEAIQGPCIYDVTTGSLRLSQRLAASFYDVVSAANDNANRESMSPGDQYLLALAQASSDLEEVTTTWHDEVGAEPLGGDWVTVIVPGEQAILINAAGTRDVEVVGYRYTPRGLLYELRHLNAGVTWMAPAETVQPIHGSRLIKVNLATDEVIEVS